MLRLIFTTLATLALLFVGALWLAAQPSGSGVREVVAPVLNRGFEIVSGAGKRAVTAASRDLLGDDDDSSRVALTPTASGVWEPEPESTDPAAGREVPAAPPAQREGASEPPPARAEPPPPRTEPPPARAEPEEPRRVAPEPEPRPLLAGGGDEAPPEEIALVPPTSRPFRESTLDELGDAGLSGAGGAAPAAESAGLAQDAEPPRFRQDDSPPPDQDDWAALIRRMLAVHSRVSRSQ